MPDTRCKHCGQRIVEKTYLWPTWEHVPGIGEFTGYRYCKRTVAEPVEVSTDV